MTTRSKVYFAQTENREAFLQQALERLGSELKLTRGQKVFVKPSLVSYEPYPTTTHPLTLARVLDFLLSLGCELVVGDGPAFDAGSAEDIVAHHPLQQVCQERGLKLLNLHEQPFKRVKTGKLSLEISALAFDCDFLISLPVLRPHRACGLTGALKNQFGFLRNRERILLHLGWKDLNRGIAELNQVVRPSFFIVDALESYQKAHERRHGGEPIKLGYLLAGRDPVALDCFGLELLKTVEASLKHKKPEDIKQLAYAVELGLGSMEYEPVRLAISSA